MMISSYKTATWDTIVNKLSFVVLLLFGVILGILFLPSEWKTTGVFYFFTILFSVGFAMIAQPSASKPVKKMPLFCSFLCLYFVLAFRDMSGVDDMAYYTIFEDVNTYGWKFVFLTSFMEPGYLFINQVIGSLTSNYYVFQAIMSFIPMFLIYRGFAKYSKEIYIPFAVLMFSCMLYFQMLSVSLVRMFIAISIIFCYSFNALFKGESKKFILTILFSALFHYSSLIMLLFTPLTFSGINIVAHWKRISFLIIIVVPFLFLLAGRLAGALGGRYEQYASGEGGSSIASLDTLPFVLIALYQWKRIPSYMWGMYASCIILLIFSSVCSLMNSVVPLGRVVFYMNLSLWILYPSIFRFRRNGIVIGGLIVAYSILYLYVTQFSQEQQSTHLFPYQNIFFSI